MEGYGSKDSLKHFSFTLEGMKRTHPYSKAQTIDALINHNKTLDVDNNQFDLQFDL